MKMTSSHNAIGMITKPVLRSETSSISHDYQKSDAFLIQESISCISSYSNHLQEKRNLNSSFKKMSTLLVVHTLNINLQISHDLNYCFRLITVCQNVAGGGGVHTKVVD